MKAIVYKEYGPPEVVNEFPDWSVQATMGYLDAGDSALRVAAQDPDLMAGQDPEALKRMQKTRAIKMAPVAESTNRPMAALALALLRPRSSSSSKTRCNSESIVS